MKKKIIALILAGLMMLACVPTVVAADITGGSTKYIWNGTKYYDVDGTELTYKGHWVSWAKIRVGKLDSERNMYPFTFAWPYSSFHGSGTFYIVGADIKDDENTGIDPEIPTDIKDMTAEQVIVAWEGYTVAEKRDALEYLQSEEGSEKYAEFNAKRFPEVAENAEALKAIALFVDGIDVLPSVEQVETFVEAGEAVLEVYHNTGLDMPVPDDIVDAYENAYAEVAGVMESDAETDYPADELNGEMTGAFTSAMNSFYTVDADLTQNEIVMNALSKADSLAEIYPDIYAGGYGATTWSLTGSTDAEKLASITTLPTISNDNVEVHVFNYGAAINDASLKNRDNDGFLPFYHSLSYEDPPQAVDGTAAGNAAVPIMSKILKDGYPYIDSDATVKDASNNPVNYKGSLKYLFDKTSGFVQGNGNMSSYSELGSAYNGAKTYQSMHYYTSGESTGLFRAHNGTDYTEDGSYYYYDAADNAAWFKADSVDSNTGEFVVYNTTVVPCYTYKNNSTAIGNFLPFNQITKDTVAITTDWSGKDDGTKYAETYLKHDAAGNRTDLWFGLSAEFNFFMPEDGKIDGKAMEFSFIGDDDVWVYIDDVLILDIGGCHGAMDGFIDFSTGEVKYKNPDTSKIEDTPGSYEDGYRITNLKTLYQEAYNSLTDEEKNSPTGQKIGKLLASGFEEYETGKYRFKDYTEHSFNFFYLERGGNISTCKLKFNMQPLPTSKLTVEKNVEGLTAEATEKETFTYVLTDENNKPVKTDYMFYGEKTEERSTNDDGEFTLKDGEKAEFEMTFANDSNITEYIVKEVNVDISRYTPSCTIDNLPYPLAKGDYSSYSTDVLKLESDEDSIIVVFTNTFNILRGDLTITKDGIEAVDHDSDLTIKNAESQSSIFLVKGADFANENVKPFEFKVTIHGNDSLTIKDLPIGTYTVTELTDWTWRYDADDVEQTKTIVENGEHELTFVNNRNKLLWLSGDSFAKNLWGSEPTGILAE